MDLPARRIKVSTDSRVRVHTDEVPVTILGLSARDALLLSPRSLGNSGDIVELFLPAVGSREIELTAGVAHGEPIEQGFAVVVTFMIVEQRVRTALNDLLRLLLAGEGGGSRKHPRIIYDVPVRYGPTGQLQGRLEEVSFSGLSIRITERLLPGAEVRVTVPDYSSDANLILDGKVVQQRMAKEGGYHTGVEFLPFDGPVRGALARLLADLLCR